MTTEEIANRFKARREGRVWRARCPIHQAGMRYGRSLGIYADPDRVGLHCFGGCTQDDILAAVGLTWRDTLYEDKTLTPAEKKAWGRQKYVNRLYEAEKRIQDLNLWLESLECKQKPVRIKNSFERDIDAFCDRLTARPGTQQAKPSS
jgi:hypothetical protein